MENTAFNHAAWNTLHSIRMLWAMLQKIHCNQSGCIGPRCMDSTAYNRDPLRHNAWNLLHSMTLHHTTHKHVTHKISSETSLKLSHDGGCSISWLRLQAALPWNSATRKNQ